MLQRDLSYWWRQFNRNVLRVGYWLGILFGIAIGSLPTEKDPFKVAFLTGPIHLRFICWISAFLLLTSTVKLAYQMIFRRHVAREDIYKMNKASQLSDWEKDPHWLSFDKNVEICVAPNLIEPHTSEAQAGWKPEECRLRVIGDFPNAPRLEDNYKQWRVTMDPEKLKKDGTKYVLVNHPTSETDEHFVRLELRETKWSRVQGFLYGTKNPDPETGRNFLFQTADPDWTPDKKPRMDLTRSNCPHALCFHGIVVTRDRKILALQRPGPDRTDYHPYAWSLSFEEQLAESDLAGSNSEVDVSEWLHRAVRQEVLGKHVDSLFKVENARVLAIAIEEEIFNPFLVAYIPVECDSSELPDILPLAADRAEWLRYGFYDIEPPFDALVAAYRTCKHTDGNALHPTSRYRIYLALTALLPSNLDVGQILKRQSE